MPEYICPRHNKVIDMKGKFGPFCPTKVDGKWCSYPKSDEFKAILARIAPVATPTPGPKPELHQASDSGSPRLQAALAALAAAARVNQGTGKPPAEIMTDAACYYHRFLKRAFMGEIPTVQESDFGPGPDDDIPF